MTITPSPTEVPLTNVLARDGIDIAWDAWGDPASTPLVLVHGFTGSSHDFALQVPTLAASRRVVALDHRGHGVSTKARRLDAYSLDLLADDVASLLASLACGPVDLLGHSMGGRVVLGVALARPDLVRSLILMDTSAGVFGDPGSRRLAAIRDYFAQYDPATSPPAPSMPSPEEALVEAATPLAWRERKAELSAGVDPYAIKALGRELFDDATSVQGRLGEIDCPTTVIVGSEDHPLVEIAPALAEGIAGSALTVIDGAYHSPQVTHPEPWRRAVEDHLARVT